MRNTCGHTTRRLFLKGSCLAMAGLSSKTLMAQDAKSPAPVKLSFGLFTDAHYADANTLGLRCYRASMTKLAECVQLMNEKNVDFLIELGDLKDQRTPPSEATTLQDLETIEQAFKQFNGPRYHVLGNHDMDSISKAQFLSKVTNTGIPANASYYSFDAKGIHCIVLDANYKADGSDYDHGKFDWKDANIPKAQLDWLRQDLETTAHPVLVFVHQQLDVETATGVKNAQRVRQILEKSKKVLAVFQGHHHPGHYGVLNTIHYLTLNAMVEGSKPENNAYAIVEVRADLSLTVTGYRRVISRQLEKQ